MLYADGNEICWGLVNYMYRLGKIFLPFIDLTDSESFMAADSIAKMGDLLGALLKMKPPSGFAVAHREFIFSTLDYLVGNRETMRYKCGNDIKSRADDYSILGFFLELSGKDFKFKDIREKALKKALANEVITQEDDVLVSGLGFKAIKYNKLL